MLKAFSRIDLKNISLKNRFVRSATHDYMGNADGSVSHAEVALYEELSKNEIGLIISAHACVSKGGSAGAKQNAVYDDKFIPGLKSLVDAAHEYNSKIILQISHAGPRSVTLDGSVALSVSAVGQENTREADIADIIKIREAFIAAALRAKKAGFDGVQVHAAHGYLLSQFIDPLFNKRDDIYGGSAENRFRLVQEIISGIKRRCGETFPIFLKINSDSLGDDKHYSLDLVYILNVCKNLGVEAVELSGNFIGLPANSGPYFLSRAAEMRRTVDIPIILVGGIRSSADVEEVLSAGIDMVALGRPLICEPDLILKFKAGPYSARCISCNKCFFSVGTTGKRCVLN